MGERPKLKPLKERIAAEFRRRGRGTVTYHQMMHAVFPEEHFPRAFRCSSNGGPPGCAMAFGRALREMGVYERHPYKTGRGFLTWNP